MTTEYIDGSNSLCSNSFDSIKRHRLISDDYKISDLDCENIDFSTDNFQSEISTKASSSSIHESIANMSNSHSTPEDTFSEITLSSPSSKHCKPDFDSKDYEQPGDQYNVLNSTNNNIQRDKSQNANEFIEPLSTSSSNLKSIDDTIESVLSKIKENSFDNSQSSSFRDKLEKTTFVNELSSISASNVPYSNSCAPRNLSISTGSHSSDVAFFNTKTGMSGPLSCTNNNSYSAVQHFSKLYPQFYNYNTAYGVVPPQIASSNFSSSIGTVNFNDYNKIEYHGDSKSTAATNTTKYSYYPYQLPNYSFRQYISSNSYLNQPFYKSDSGGQTVTVGTAAGGAISAHNNSNPNYQMFSKSLKRNAYFDQIYVDDDVSHLYRDGDKNSSFMHFKTPQSNLATGVNCADGQHLDQPGSTRKKRNNSDVNKLTPSKKRKLSSNQVACSNQLANNSYDDIIRKLKIANYNALLMNPTMMGSPVLLSPKGFVESVAKSEKLKKSIKYKKYQSALFKINKPKVFRDFRHEDQYLSQYFDENALDQCILSQRKGNWEATDEFPEIVSGSPTLCNGGDWAGDTADPIDLPDLSVVDDGELDPRSPELRNSCTKRKITTEHSLQPELSADPKSMELNCVSKHFMTPIVSYTENETKLVTEVHSVKSQELLNRNYIKLSGSFLKRTKINGKSFSNIHIEEAVSIASLSASKTQNSCHYCFAFLTGLSCIRKSAKLFGLDSPDDLLFCSNSCYCNFKSCNSVYCNFEKKLLNTSSSATATIGNNNNTVSLTNNLQCSRILIKTASFKPTKNYKKSCDFEQYVRRRFPSEGQDDCTATVQKPQVDSSTGSTESQKKRLIGVNYSYFKSEIMKTIVKEIDKSDQNLLLKKYSCSYQKPDLVDRRTCLLCQEMGDGDENISGRLINIDADNWVHLNCALWCFEVFETVSGSLMEVESSLQKAVKAVCTFCNKTGAGIQCYRSKCPCVYHVPCAYKIGCIFYTDRGMYCPNHVVLNHPMHLPLLKVERRVYILRDEIALIAKIVSEDQDVKIKFRTGSLTLHNIGQLLPDQLTSGHYNSSSIIYPVGYHATRIYWSSTQINKRCKYECFIDEHQDRPLFIVKFIDHINGCEQVVSDRSCDKLWKSILNKIAKLRQDNGLARLFPLYLSGEMLFGLTEPHIIRVIESLPGVEMVKNYAFKFGKMQLITEMPLAINPTGCARSEPKLRTYVRRFHDYDEYDSKSLINKCGILKAKSNGGNHHYHHHPHTNIGNHGNGSGVNSNSHNNTNHNQFHELVPLTKTALLNSKTQQYKRLKFEWVNNVILSRSKIQGLGLFAAKDFEKSTMIIEYIGEIIRNEVGNCREKLYQARNNSIYMFRLNEDLIIDATVNGGLARYINHSCNPNCVAETLSLDCGNRIIITTRQMIERGEELTYDYKFDFENNKADRIPCLCGAINCRKWMN